MSIRITAKGKKVLAKIKGVDKALTANLERGLYFVGKSLRNTASKNILKKPRLGKVYKHKKRKHTASVSGESWANKSGTARRSIAWKVISPRKLLYFVPDSVEYAEYLENTKGLNRPAMLISIKQNRRNIVSVMEENMKKSLEA